MAVYDGFLFFNELDLLEIRLIELDPVVDVFVLVEAETTFRGAPKPLVFSENRDRFARWRHKIRYVRAPTLSQAALSGANRLHATKRPRSDDWARQWLQRDAILQGVEGAAPDDVVMVSDVDEIPSREAVGRLREKNACRGRVLFFRQDHFVNFLDWRRDAEPWVGTRAVLRRHLPSPQALRLTHCEGNVHTSAWLRYPELRVRTWRDFGAPLSPEAVRDAGWHFTSLGGAEAVARKMRSISEKTHDDAHWTADTVAALWSRGLSHDGAAIRRIDDARLPHAVRDDPARYEHLTSASLARMEQQNG